jgi:hypothetical protein
LLLGDLAQEVRSRTNLLELPCYLELLALLTERSRKASLKARARPAQERISTADQKTEIASGVVDALSRNERG